MGLLLRKPQRVRRQAMPVAVSIQWKPLRDSHYVVASLQPGGGGLRQIFVRQATLREVQALARRDQEWPVVGLLLGERLDCSLTLKPYVLIEGHVEVALGSLDAREISDAIAGLRANAGRKKSVEVLGWFAAGRAMDEQVSRTHATVHAACFEERWHTLLTIGDSGHTGAFHLHDASAARWFQAPFFEVTDSKANSRAPKPTCVAWPAYLTTTPVAPVAEALQPVPVLPPRPFVAAPISAPVSAPVSAPARERAAGLTRPIVRTRRTPTRDAIIEAGRAVRRSAFGFVRSIGGGIVRALRRAAGKLVTMRAEWAASAARRKAEAEAERTREAERRAREQARRAKQEAERRAAREEAERLAAEAEKKRAAEAAARRAAEAEARRIAEEEAERRRAAEAEARRKAAEEAERRRVAEVEARRLAAEAEAEARRRVQEAEAEARRKAEEEAAEARRKAAEAEAKRQAEEAEARRIAAEAEARRLAEEAEARRAAEEEARRKAEEEAQRLAAEEAQRRAAEDEQRRVSEAEARRQAAEAESRRQAKMAEALRLAEAEAEARRQAAAAEARRQAEAEAKRLAAEADEEARRQEAVAEALRISVEVAAFRERLARPPVEVEGGNRQPRAPINHAPDSEDTTASDGPYRYLALARREGFEVSEKIERGSAEHPETVWLLHERESGLRLTIVSNDEQVREASLHYNLRTEDDSLLRITAPEHRDLDSRTIYGREACLHDLRARCRRLRGTGALVRDWKVTPSFHHHPVAPNGAPSPSP